MRKSIFVLFLLFFFFCFSTPVFPDSGMVDRMKSRIPKIITLKTKGAIHESDRAYLVYSGSDASVIKLIKEENADRLIIYKHVAKQQKTTLEIVEKRRALTLKRRDAGINPSKKTNPIVLVPEKIGIIILTNCKKSWPEDFRQQRYCINEEVKAWLDMN